MTLKERFTKAILDKKFTDFELKGFTVQPTLGIMAGISIGYEMATDDMQDTLDKLVDAYEEAVHVFKFRMEVNNGSKT